ncbi:phosphatase PAP2 family protein [Autumnicola musiva]|uniref:Phosphatase PAP2 family protein n=1 Tax=Autumnicola musiva TaxID=3075589 RepID=A0ABU3D9N9_9FLAO|nr:phosphatase PAP2 family protein [Zunongwangia sp. F117]MDT0678171.1 phosphatase PAP2 family protein [Zunongwangia sp. F117]
MQELLEIDKEIFLFLNNLGSAEWDWFWRAMSDKWTGLPLYLLLIYLSFKDYGWKITLLNMVLVTLLILATGEVAYDFKQAFERLRPCAQEGVVEYARVVTRGCGGFSFVSAHATNSTGVAVFLFLLFKRFHNYFAAALLLWPVLTSYSRIYQALHYPSDVIAGIVLGVILAFIVYQIQLFISKKYLGADKIM